MQRPLMNPMFLSEPQAAAPGTGIWRRAGRLLWRVARLLVTDLLRRRNGHLRVEDGSPFSRFLRGLMYRLTFVPVLLAILVTCLVFSATHPYRPPVSMDPAGLGIHYDPVDLLAADNTRLEGWLVPVVDARRVLVEGDNLLHQRYPAIVLAHDFGASRQQMLPLIAPLHDAGYVVLAINLRGNASRSTASTFGLNEAQDIRAAVDLLRRRPFVDPDAVGVLGLGTGATAALLATQQDPRLHVLVLDHPVRQFENILSDHIGPRQPWMAWLRPMCKWAFEIGYKVNATDVNLDRFALQMRSAPVLLLDDPMETVSSLRPMRQRQVIEFLKKHLVARQRGVVTLLPPAYQMEEPAPEPEWPLQRSARDIVHQAGVKD